VVRLVCVLQRGLQDQVRVRYVLLAAATDRRRFRDLEPCRLNGKDLHVHVNILFHGTSTSTMHECIQYSRSKAGGACTDRIIKIVIRSIRSTLCMHKSIAATIAAPVSQLLPNKEKNYIRRNTSRVEKYFILTFQTE